MKNNVAQFILLIISSITTAFGAPILTEGLGAYFPFDGNIRDESGNGNHGALVPSVSFAPDRFGRINSAIEIATGTRIVLPSSTIKGPLTSRNASFVFWRKKGAAGHMLSKYLQRDAGQSEYMMSLEANNVNAYGNGLDVVSLVAPSDNEWSQVAITIQSTGSVVVYLDAAMIGNGTMTLNANETSTPLVLGRASGSDDDAGWFNGTIDDLRIYNRALSPAEVATLFAHESLLQPQNPRIATANAQVVNGFLVGAIITDGGSGYTNSPGVTISGGGGSGAVATAAVIDGVVTAINISNSGSGYSGLPIITIAAPPFPPRRATATSSIVNGFVVDATISDGGYGYDSPPAVRITGGGGSGASGTAIVVDGVVTAITINNSGSGYTSAPKVLLASPPFSPKLSIEVSRVRVTLQIVLSRRYQLESSSDLLIWSPVGGPFVAEAEELIQEFEVSDVGRFFRIYQVP